MEVTRVASFHLATFPLRRSLSKMITVPAERWELTDSQGCVLGKVLGTSRVGTTKMSVELRRWAIFAVWEDDASRQAFLGSSELLDRWNQSAETIEHTLLTPLKGRGSWGGTAPFDEGGDTSPAAPSAAIAVVTRATVKPTKLLSFQRAVPPVDAALQHADGCQLALGMGEWPVGQQATYSVWNNEKSLQEFAYSGAVHSEVIKRRYREGWYREELFARFAVESVTRPS